MNSVQAGVIRAGFCEEVAKAGKRGILSLPTKSSFCFSPTPQRVGAGGAVYENIFCDKLPKSSSKERQAPRLATAALFIVVKIGNNINIHRLEMVKEIMGHPYKAIWASVKSYSGRA